MRQTTVLSSLFVTVFVQTLFASRAPAATLYVSPSGDAAAECSRSLPCDLATGASSAVAGDTVILMDGVYKQQLYVANSGTEGAWITFQNEECATPIIEGIGVGPTEDNQDVGVGSREANYVRFIGLVSRGWNAGFSNGWTAGDDHSVVNLSNGHLEFKHCIADGNGRTGFTFFSAPNVRIQYCISAHNGSSTTHSWSSGITLYQTQGTPADNVVEGTISFENMDGQKHTDGSGFIVDEGSNGATFVNNIAFRNGGSCLRLTRSSNAHFINNTCYHNSQDSKATGPTNPGELYFTDSSTKNGVSFINNVLVATGVGPGKDAVFGQPGSGWSNNVVATGSVSFFTSADTGSPDFTLLASATTLVGMGLAGADTPPADVGFDPKCIIKTPPTLVGSIAAGDWWQYSVDLEYIKQIGGVARCFNPKPRTGAIDIGAYVAAGATPATGVCVPPPPPPPMATTAGTTPDITSVPVPTATAVPGATTSGTAPSASSSTAPVPAGSTPGGNPSSMASGSSAPPNGSTVGGSMTASAAPLNSAGGAASSTPAGCGCDVVGRKQGSRESIGGLGILGVVLVGCGRRWRAAKRRVVSQH